MTVGYLPPLWMQKKPNKPKKVKRTEKGYRNDAFRFPTVFRELIRCGYRKDQAARAIVKHAKETKDIKLKVGIAVQLLNLQRKNYYMTTLLEQMCDEQDFDPGLTTIKLIQSGKLELRDECYFDMKLREALLKEKGETINVNHGGLAGVLAGIGNDGGSENTG